MAKKLALFTGNFIELWSSIKYLFYTFFIFVGLDIDIFNIVVLLVLIDILAGVVKTIVVPSLRFSFKKLWDGFISKMILILLPIVLALAVKASGGDLAWFSNGVLKAIILSEVVSIVTNFISIRKKENVVNKDYLVMILEYVRNKITSFLNRLLSGNKPLE